MYICFMLVTKCGIQDSQNAGFTFGNIMQTGQSVGDTNKTLQCQLHECCACRDKHKLPNMIVLMIIIKGYGSHPPKSLS